MFPSISLRVYIYTQTNVSIYLVFFYGLYGDDIIEEMGVNTNRKKKYIK